MPSQVATLAQGVADALNGAPPGTFAQAFTAVRKYVPGTPLEELKDVVVLVVPKANDRTTLTRAATQKEIQVDVCVQQRLPQDLDPDSADANATVDALMLLVEQVAARLDFCQVPAANAGWVATKNDPIYDPEQLRKGLFQSLITLTFKAV